MPENRITRDEAAIQVIKALSYQEADIASWEIGNQVYSVKSEEEGLFTSCFPSGYQPLKWIHWSDLREAQWRATHLNVVKNAWNLEITYEVLEEEANPEVPAAVAETVLEEEEPKAAPAPSKDDVVQSYAEATRRELSYISDDEPGVMDPEVEADFEKFLREQPHAPEDDGIVLEHLLKELDLLRTQNSELIEQNKGLYDHNAVLNACCEDLAAQNHDLDSKYKALLERVAATTLNS